MPKSMFVLAILALVLALIVNIISLTCQVQKLIKSDNIFPSADTGLTVYTELFTLT